MDCPYCGREMEAGTFRSRGVNYFLPDGRSVKLHTRSQLEKADAVVLPPDWMSTSLPVEWPAAYCCRGCKKIIIGYEGEHGIFS